jgi:IclR family pca regulon transcriptional regulator
MPNGDPQYMLSLARGLEVIRAFERGRPSLTIAEVARITGISRAAARRCLYTLGMLGYVSTIDGAYELSPRALALGYAYLSSLPFAHVAHAAIERISDRLHESCSVAVLNADDIVYIARASTRRIMSVDLSVGSRLPAYCTSMGRVLLAYSNEADVDAYLARVPLTAHTPHTVTSVAKFRAELESVRHLGYSLVDQELELGLRSIAVPVRRADGRAVAAVNVGTQAARVDKPTMIRTYLPALREAAEEITIAARR